MTTEATSTAKSSGRWLLWTASGLGVCVVVLLLLGVYALHNAEPFLKQRAIASLEQSFHAHVELDRLDIFPRSGYLVSGGGLRITPIGLEAYPPAVSVRSFEFRIRPWDLFDATRHVRFAHVDGLVITLPPAPARHASASGPKAGNHARIIVDAFVCDNAEVVILHDKPEKTPTTFVINKLKVATQLLGGPLRYEAFVVNPKPAGNIHSVGTFGPWVDDNPRTTPVTGDFTFSNADLGTIRGVGGILSSKGHFGGPLNRLVVDGTTQTPDFRIAESGHPVALFTTYHAIVDGSTGDTYLQPVQAHFRNTYFTCSGSVVNEKGADHHIQLDVNMQRGRMEDVLWLATKSSTPIMQGALRLRTSFDLPPEPQHDRGVVDRLYLNGNFHLDHISFTKADWDRQIDEISLRTQGKPEEADALSEAKGRDDIAITSAMEGNFTLTDGQVLLHPATFTMPGITATMHGSYALSGKINIAGQARLDVPVSHLVTGWKSALAKLADPLFRKNGAPALIPFQVVGPRDNPEFKVQVLKGFSIGMKKH